MLEYIEISSMSLSEGCWYCGGEADTWDHIVPRSLDGTDDVENLAPCCRSCNSRKGAKPLYKFRHYLASNNLYSEFDTPDPQKILGTFVGGFHESLDEICFHSIDGSLKLNFYEYIDRVYCN